MEHISILNMELISPTSREDLTAMKGTDLQRTTRGKEADLGKDIGMGTLMEHQRFRR